MRKIRGSILASLLFAVSSMGYAGDAPPAKYSSGIPGIGVWDGPSLFFPGKYFENKAQFYLKNKDYRAAL